MDIIFNVKDGELENAGSLKIAEAIVKVLDTKKANDIKVLKIDKKTIIADYFVICTGNSSTQIKTLADEVDYQLGVGKVPYVRLEGTDSNEWKVIMTILPPFFKRLVKPTTKSYNPSSSPLTSIRNA